MTEPVQGKKAVLSYKPVRSQAFAIQPIEALCNVIDLKEPVMHLEDPGWFLLLSKREQKKSEGACGFVSSFKTSKHIYAYFVLMQFGPWHK